jgi:hypothetical protein
MSRDEIACRIACQTVHARAVERERLRKRPATQPSGGGWISVGVASAFMMFSALLMTHSVSIEEDASAPRRSMVTATSVQAAPMELATSSDSRAEIGTSESRQMQAQRRADMLRASFDP